ncbi:anti-sigma factor antagonist [Conexibacter sp. W3-3-2]|uniref:STAS domain-containing protein n=1 Tax=Conexibacter sp. W3-3-2 TaxID=2675227 RepID=UPI0012B72A64|nr:STAS domain-containing protein [Conexibacter sp. W3-3-2]MTD46353.1 anti-sigma factor antagonist [Conexibacter sp. W3-3-2]
MHVRAEALRPDRVLVSASGPLDLATAPRLADVLRAESPGRNVIVDLSDATFIDSTGLAVLLNASRRAVARSTYLVVVCPQGPVLRMFELALLLETLRVVDSVAAALDALDATENGPYRAV